MCVCVRVCVCVCVCEYKDCGGTYCHLSRYTLKMEAVDSFVMLVPLHQATRF